MKTIFPLLFLVFAAGSVSAQCPNGVCPAKKAVSAPRLVLAGGTVTRTVKRTVQRAVPARRVLFPRVRTGAFGFFGC